MLRTVFLFSSSIDSVDHEQPVWKPYYTPQITTAMTRFTGLVLLLVLFLGTVAAEDSYSFINPPPPEKKENYGDNPVYPLGSVLDIQWRTPDASNYVSMVLYQRRPNVDFEYVFENVGGLTSYRWRIQTSRDVSVSPVFFLQIFKKGSKYPAARSHYFNLTEPADSSSSITVTPALTTIDTSTLATSTGGISTTTGGHASTTSATPSTSSKSSSANTLSSTTVTPTTSTTTDMPTTAAPTAGVDTEGDSASTTSATPSTTSSSSPSGNGLSTGVKAGIGAGVGVAGLVVLAAAVFLVLRRRRRIAETQAMDVSPDTAKFADLPTSTSMLKSRSVQELPATSTRPVELPT